VARIAEWICLGRSGRNRAHVHFWDRTRDVQQDSGDGERLNPDIRVKDLSRTRSAASVSVIDQNTRSRGAAQEISSTSSASWTSQHRACVTAQPAGARQRTHTNARTAAEEAGDHPEEAHNRARKGIARRQREREERACRRQSPEEHPQEEGKKNVPTGLATSVDVQQHHHHDHRPRGRVSHGRAPRQGSRLRKAPVAAQLRARTRRARPRSTAQARRSVREGPGSAASAGFARMPGPGLQVSIIKDVTPSPTTCRRPSAAGSRRGLSGRVRTERSRERTDGEVSWSGLQNLPPEV